MDMHRLLIHLHMSVNQRPEPFVDHAGVLRDSKTGRPINGRASPDSDGPYDDDDTMREFRLNPVNERRRLIHCP